MKKTVAQLEMGKLQQSTNLQQSSLNFGGTNKIRDESEGHLEANFVIPPFSKDWTDEYLIATFQPRAFKAVAFLVTVFAFCTVVCILADGQDGVGGSPSMFYWTWAPYTLCGTAYTLLAILFSLDRFRPLCIRHYNALCALSILLLYLAFTATYVLLELRSAAFGSTDYPHILRSINLTAFPPPRTCVDTDPGRTWAITPRILSFAPGSCEPMVLAG
eukprot:CAMPEP_0172160844 /NCGR_PEP_ID=MMETSP1050-20130122/5790_1 /TAXON_ID=233186 /ORGANISM="Cryptomonas curvata, Strain CCAP979/52" /LENGTH=216 /DNA_ID=CAMNT_0012830665 /DNA_START=216 /DNA_END=862 /DNA_ORIENTATION=-